MIDNLQLRLLICDNGTREVDSHQRFALRLPVTIPDALSAAACIMGADSKAFARLEGGA